MGFMDWLGTVADILGIITALVAVPAVIRFLFYEPKRRKEIEKLMNEKGKSAVLAVGLGEKAEGMKSQVMRFVNGNPSLLEQAGGELLEGINFFTLENLTNLPKKDKDEGLYAQKPEQYLHEFIQDVNKTMVIMAENGINRIHLFYQGPAILAAPLGAALSNRFAVTCYHYSKSDYYAVGFLQEPIQ